MRLVFRCDGDGRIGGGHVMRCLTLAQAARTRGWEAAFVCAEGGFSDRVAAAGFPLTTIPPAPARPDPGGPPHAHWLSVPWEADAAITAHAAGDADWLIWDHYGLDARWARAVGAPRAMALDDLDDRALGSDVVLDATRLDGKRVRDAPIELIGPDYVPLRPEFAQARPAALARRDGPVRRLIVLPGLADAVGLAPLALDALRDLPFDVEVVMGADAQSRAAAEARLGRHVLTLDPPDMAARMTMADLCVGASGMTNWERCALGLPTVAVAVADNQVPGLDGLARRGAVVPLTLADARDPARLRAAVEAAADQAGALSRAAAAICDGLGADRVLDALDWRWRPLTEADGDLLFHWRNRPDIRAASHDVAPLDPRTHAGWVRRAVARNDGIWAVYEEGGRPLGHANAVTGADGWTWSFYLGAPAPKGTGTRMMRRFLDRLCAAGAPRVIGEVKAGNTASATLHRRLGFEQVDARAGVLVFARDLRNTDAEETRR